MFWTTIIFVLIYLVLILVSMYIIHGRPNFTPQQKNIHVFVTIIFPIWGILIGQFSSEPAKGSHFYRDKKNKYDGSPEHDHHGRVMPDLNGPDSHYESTL